MLNYISRLVTTGMFILGITGCSEPVPEGIEKALVSLKKEAVKYCEAADEDARKFYQGRKNSWVTLRKNGLLGLLGCEPGCIGWKCENNGSGFKIREETSDCRCENEDLVGVAAGFTEEQRKEYHDLINGEGVWDYEPWLERRKEKKEKLNQF